MKTDVFAIYFSICYLLDSKPDFWVGFVPWFGLCGRGFGEDKKLAILLSGETFYKKEECHALNLIRIIKVCQKETSLLWREDSLGIIVCCEHGVFFIWWASVNFLKALWYCLRKWACVQCCWKKQCLKNNANTLKMATPSLCHLQCLCDWVR